MTDPRTRPRIDLNADLGEQVTDDRALLAVVTSASLACGYHAGTRAVMQEVCGIAAERGVSVGAHVSYDDRARFGRVALEVAPELLREQVADQVGTLAVIAAAEGVVVRYLKPHGALYHRTQEDPVQAAAVLSGSGDLAVLGMDGALLSQAVGACRRVVREGFADRGYAVDGRLIPRGEPGDLLLDQDEVAAHAVALAAEVDSVCVHGDTPGAVAHAVAVRHALEVAGHRLVGL